MPARTEIRLTNSGNGIPLVDINGVRDWTPIGGSFDAVRLVGGRHPGDWYDDGDTTHSCIARRTVHPASGKDWPAEIMV